MSATPCPHCGPTLVEVPTEVEELRAELAAVKEAVANADWERAATRLRARAEQAEARLARFRAYLDSDFRQWCSPHGVAAEYATRLIEVLDRPLEEHR